MDARIGDDKQKEKNLSAVKAARMEVKVTCNGDHIRAYDEGVLVLAMMRVSKTTWAFRYNRAYWNGL
jgi:hypothetical protein